MSKESGMGVTYESSTLEGFNDIVTKLELQYDEGHLKQGIFIMRCLDYLYTVEEDTLINIRNQLVDYGFDSYEVDAFLFKKSTGTAKCATKCATKEKMYCPPILDGIKRNVGTFIKFSDSILIEYKKKERAQREAVAELIAYLSAMMDNTLYDIWCNLLSYGYNEKDINKLLWQNDRHIT